MVSRCLKGAEINKIRYIISIPIYNLQTIEVRFVHKPLYNYIMK